MSTIQVEGLHSLKGEIEIQGSKNAVLPMMAAAILNTGTTVIENVPRIQDVFCMMGILEYLGCVCSFEGHRMVIDASSITSASIPEHYVRSMRSSIMILGALLGRCGEAVTQYPGGCSIGKRPIDLHLYSLRCLGAEILEKEEHVYARACRLKGSEIRLSYPSVGATENALLAAVQAEGDTLIHGAARDPEIEDLCLFLINMGAQIEGAGTSVIRITGGRKLHDSSYHVAGDRIVAGTYMAAAAAAGGNVILNGIRSQHMNRVLAEFEKMGVEIEAEDRRLMLSSKTRPLPLYLETGPYPQFPTDLQSPVMAAMSVAKGDSVLIENVFEGRFETAKELVKLGAKIEIHEREARIFGSYPLSGAFVEARDLRGGAALVVAALASEGITTIGQCYHIMRGYEDICRDLRYLGANIEYQVS